ncbi:hypothetical protein T484DRAFT_1764980 [Baffinella frigidus]|nr:hypothetical protein T484DRAFT_1764980 [Cryptophyta sp. CCMP2293]|mmetsp:Transcript_52951/g.126025  ORF Transcript_52951/g.126025 Transcript_52951/m.126025 type:complete len:168 (+) Transcript_52951:131-634(+)
MRPREVVRRYLEVVKRDLGATGAVIAPYTAAQLVLLILIAFGPVLLDVRLREVASSKLGDFKLVGALLCVAGFIVAQYGQTISTPRSGKDGKGEEEDAVLGFRTHLKYAHSGLVVTCVGWAVLCGSAYRLILCGLLALLLHLKAGVEEEEDAARELWEGAVELECQS